MTIIREPQATAGVQLLKEGISVRKFSRADKSTETTIKLAADEKSLSWKGRRLSLAKAADDRRLLFADVTELSAPDELSACLLLSQASPRARSFTRTTSGEEVTATFHVAFDKPRRQQYREVCGAVSREVL